MQFIMRRSIARMGLLAALACALGGWAPRAAVSADLLEPPLRLEDGLRELERGAAEASAEARRRYGEWSAPAVESLKRRWGGSWWVLHFRAEMRPDRIRGVIPGEYLLAAEGEAVERGGIVKEGLLDIVYCCGTSFGAPRVAEDDRTYTVIYPQVRGGVPVEGAGLALRMLKSFAAADLSREQWNVEINDLTLDLPADLDHRPSVTPDGAMASFRAAGVPAGDLAGEPELLFCRGGPAGGLPVLCWQLEGAEAYYRLDAVKGTMLGEVDKSRRLR